MQRYFPCRHTSVARELRQILFLLLLLATTIYFSHWAAMIDETVASPADSAMEDLPDSTEASLPAQMSTSSIPTATATSGPTPPSPTRELLVLPASPTAPSTVIPTQTTATPVQPTVTSQLTLQANGFARITGTQGSPVRVRARPGMGQPIVGQLQEGTFVQVLDGPQRATGLAWWRIDQAGTRGWVAAPYLLLVPTATAQGKY